MPANTDKLRAELVNMLLNDRSFARQTGNASAATAASTRVVDLMLGNEEADSVRPPVTVVVHEIVRTGICRVCKERLPVDAFDWSPPRAVDVTGFKPGTRSGWDDVPEEPPEPARKPAEQPVLKIPKTPEQMHRRRRDPTVKGIA